MDKMSIWKKFLLFWDEVERAHRKAWLRNQRIHKKFMGED